MVLPNWKALSLNENYIQGYFREWKQRVRHFNAAVQITLFFGEDTASVSPKQRHTCSIYYLRTESATNCGMYEEFSLGWQLWKTSLSDLQTSFWSAKKIITKSLPRAWKFLRQFPSPSSEKMGLGDLIFKYNLTALLLRLFETCQALLFQFA